MNLKLISHLGLFTVEVSADSTNVFCKYDFKLRPPGCVLYKQQLHNDVLAKTNRIPLCIQKQKDHIHIKDPVVHVTVWWIMEALK